jgi:hypothetical protein
MDLQIAKRLKAGGFRTGRAVAVLALSGVMLAVLVTMSAQVSDNGRKLATHATASVQRNAEADAFVSAMAYIKNGRAGAGRYSDGDYMPALRQFAGLSEAAPWAIRLSAIGHEGVVTVTDQTASKDVCATVMEPRSYAMLTFAGDKVEIHGRDGTVTTDVRTCTDGVDLVATIVN